MSKTKLEKEFDKALANFGAIINSKVNLANKALEDKSAHPAGARALVEASALADKHGIPFHSEVVAIGNYVMKTANNYVPESYFAKFQELDPEKVAALTNVASFALSKAVDDEEDDEEDDWDDSWESSDSY